MSVFIRVWLSNCPFFNSFSCSLSLSLVFPFALSYIIRMMLMISLRRRRRRCRTETLAVYNRVYASSTSNMRDIQIITGVFNAQHPIHRDRERESECVSDRKRKTGTPALRWKIRGKETMKTSHSLELKLEYNEALRQVALSFSSKEFTRKAEDEREETSSAFNA